MSYFGKRVQITTMGGQTVTGKFVDYYNLHLCIDTGPEVRWVAMGRIKTMALAVGHSRSARSDKPNPA